MTLFSTQEISTSFTKCYCSEFDKTNIGENREGMTICFGCGLVLERLCIVDYDETINYNEGEYKSSRTDGIVKKSYLSQSSNNSMGTTCFSKYITNSLMWENLNHYDIVILKMKTFLENQSYSYGFSSGKIEEFLCKYRNFLEKRATKNDANFKGRHLKGILAVFAYIIFSPMTQERCCELFDLKDDTVTFNKCCKYYKTIYGEDIHTVNNFNTCKKELIDEILENIDIPYNVKTLIKKGYNVCKTFDVLPEIHRKKTIVYILVFFLSELGLPIDSLNDYMKFVTTTDCKTNITKLRSVKYQIFNEIKTSN